ncbi:hypothetical protein Hdeb2414_s0005g00156571 [Helianthus debilis subsp. tardiflorus]
MSGFMYMMFGLVSRFGFMNLGFLKIDYERVKGELMKSGGMMVAVVRRGEGGGGGDELTMMMNLMMMMNLFR